MRKFYTILFFVLCFFPKAQEKDTIQQIEEVSFLKQIEKPILPPQILLGKDLARLNSYSVADALRYFSGVQIKDYGGIGGLKTVDIRGMGSQHVGVFYDGIAITNAQNGIVDLSKFSIDDLESIQLYNGQKSTIFQSAQDYGTSGQIYLQTKVPTFKNGRKTNLEVRDRWASIKTFNPSFRWEQKISDKIASTVSAEYLDTDGVYKFRLKSRLPNGSIAYDTIAKRHDAGVVARRIEWNLDKPGLDNHWNIHAYAYSSNRGLPGAIVANNFGAVGQKLSDRNYFLQGTWVKKLSSKVRTQLKGKLAYDYNRYIDTLSPGGPKIDNTYLQREIYLSSSTMFEITKNWDTDVAVDFQYNNMDANLGNFSEPTRYTTLVALATHYQWGKLKAQASLLGTLVQNKTVRNKTPGNENRWTPAIFLSYQPFKTPDFQLHGFYKQSFRLPTFNELYYKTVGFTLLKPEYTQQYDLGFQYTKGFSQSLFKNIGLKIDGYYNNVKNKITSSFAGNMFFWRNLNLGKVIIKGIDVNLQTEMDFGAINLRPMLSYSYEDARDFTDKNQSFYGDLIPYAPRNSASFTAMTGYKTWSFNYSFIYVGGRYDSNQLNIASNYLPRWMTHDLSLQKVLNINTHQVTASFEVNNLFNQYYDVIRNYPMPGRNYRITLKFIL